MTTVDMHTLLAVLEPIGVTLDVKSADVTLDEASAPYADVRLTCAMLSPEDRALFDLRASDIRLSLDIRQDFGEAWSLASLTADIGGSMAALTALLGGLALGNLTNRYYRPWNGSAVIGTRHRILDLYVIQREFDDVGKEVTLTARSDEALLIGDALISTSPLDPASTSLRTISEKVLARYGAPLEPGATDATVAEVDATVWKPGVGAWAYLNPLLEAASLRLWCDELGVWRLTERQSTTPGAVTITPTGTMTGHRDTMTLNPDVWYDAVVVEYRWTDAFDLNRVEYDVAGPQPAKAVLREKRDQVVYPGPGAAAGILNRGQGRGRVLDVEAVSDYRVSPGMAATVTPPETPAQTGFIAAVNWRLPADEMSVSTRGLVDTPPESWLFAPTGLAWLDIAIGTSWLEYTP